MCVWVSCNHAQDAFKTGVRRRDRTFLVAKSLSEHEATLTCEMLAHNISFLQMRATVVANTWRPGTGVVHKSGGGYAVSVLPNANTMSGRPELTDTAGMDQWITVCAPAASRVCV